MKLFSSPRFLAVYSGILTAAFAVTIFTGFDAAAKRPKFDEVTVQRINVVEPDGTLRLVISNRARTPGIFMKGKEYLPGLRDTAGMIFLNDEGSENGGLTFSGRKDPDGTTHSSGHISFDAYMQDQLISMTATETGEARRGTIAVNDQPFWDITEYLELVERIIDLPEDQQRAALEEFFASHPQGANRIIFGRGGDRSVALALKDPEGRPRLVLQVNPDGTPTVQLLNAAGEVISQLP
jgi:hypothetical protein